MGLTSKQRVDRAIRSGYDDACEPPDRVPTFCQLSIGYYFINSGLDPFDIWYRSESFAEALVGMQRRVGFDGILVNLPGRDPHFEYHVDRLERGEREDVVWWKNGNYTRIPHDDNPHYFLGNGDRYFPTFEDLDPETLYYVEPWDLTDVTYPFTWGFDEEPRPFDSFFEPFHQDTLKSVIEKAGDSASVHAEIFSPFAQFLELLNFQNGLMAMILDPGKVHACLERLTLGAADLGKRQAACGPDALLISDAFAGGGFISRKHYTDFVLPYERRVVEAIHADYPDLPIYTHTCGDIGDRLDLMLETGIQGVDTLDPPPLGTVELQDAKDLLKGKAFIKGNMDPVSTLLLGTQEDVRNEARRRIAIGKEGGGYILSTACSVAPLTPPANVEILAEVTESEGAY